MPYGKTIKLHLVDGTTTGLWSAEINASWTGRMFRVSRSALDSLNEFEDARNSGVYLLIGDPPAAGGKWKVYIGESDGVFDRLLQHDSKSEKTFWKETILVVSKDDNLTKAHTLYVESRLIAIAKKHGQVDVDNGTSPEKTLPRPDQSDMEYFIDQILLVLPVLGVTFLSPQASIQAITNENYPRFEMEIAGVKAKMEVRKGKFVVLKDSEASMMETTSISPAYSELRKTLVTAGILAPNTNNDQYTFTQDYEFNSASRAAVVVYGGNISGPQIWHAVSTKQTYGEWAEAQERAVIPQPPKPTDALTADTVT